VRDENRGLVPCNDLMGGVALNCFILGGSSDYGISITHEMI
jgi:hypothetical protein